MLKASADGGEQRLRERAHFEEQINERENQIMDLKERIMKRDLEVSQYQSRCASLEDQIQNLKRERDRLIEVSKNLKISINKFEKQNVMESMKFSDEAGMGATLGKPGTGAFKIPESLQNSNLHSR